MDIPIDIVLPAIVLTGSRRSVAWPTPHPAMSQSIGIVAALSFPVLENDSGIDPASQTISLDRYS